MVDAFHAALRGEEVFGPRDNWIPHDRAWEEIPVTDVDRLYGEFRIQEKTPTGLSRSSTIAIPWADMLVPRWGEAWPYKALAGAAVSGAVTISGPQRPRLRIHRPLDPLVVLA